MRCTGWLAGALLAIFAATPSSGSNCYIYSMDPPSGPLPAGEVGTPYQQLICVIGFNSGPILYTVTGSLPPGITTYELPRADCSRPTCAASSTMEGPSGRFPASTSRRSRPSTVRLPAAATSTATGRAICSRAPAPTPPPAPR